MRKFSIAFVLLLLSSSVHAYERFGSSGSRGSQGSSGSSGRSGQSVSVIADGSARVFDLSGGDGGNGSNGSRGGDAGCPFYSGTPNYDLVGADGGDGGDSGDGGRGGSGGSITVYFERLEDVRSISVVSRPGRGGAPGGYSADGGRGCRCSERVWRRQECYTNQQGQQVCQERSYSCSDGRDGNRGSPGNWGGTGSYGSATLIPGKGPLAPVLPSVNVPFESLNSAGTTVLLSNNRWERRSGATALFAPGSQLSDTYTIFTHRVDRKATVVWAAARPVSDLAGASLNLSLAENDFVYLRVGSSNIWADVDRYDTNEGTRFVIKRVVLEEEARNLKYLGLSGKGESLVARFEDLSGLGSLIGTRVSLSFETKVVLFFWKKRFSDTVPAELITQDGNVITVALGKLPIKPTYFVGKRKVRVAFDVHRDYLDRSTTFEVERRQEIISK